MYGLSYGIFWRLHYRALAARRQHRTWRYLAWSVAAGAIAAGSIAIAIAFLAVMWRGRALLLALPLVLYMITPMIAEVVGRRVLVPLGMVRAAYWAGWCRRGVTDPTALGMCMAAWACARKPTAEGEAWITAKRDARTPLGDAEVVVTALLAAGRGDADTARALLRSTVMMVENHPTVRELAGEWLASDAAERGAWAELAADASAARWPATPLTFLLEGIAARRVGAAGAPGVAELWARWLLAPFRTVTIALVRATAESAPEPEPDTERKGETESESESDAEAGTGPLPRAVAAHLAVANGMTASRLASAVSAWDAALGDPATHDWLTRRAHELDAPLGAIGRALREVAAAVTDDLATAADAAALGAPASRGAVGDGLAHRLRHGRLDALDAAFARWAARKEQDQPHPGIDEWRELIALHAAYNAAATAGGLELRRLAFPHAHRAGSAMAVWLWNTRREYVISHAISRWLLDEALVVGDAQAIELGHRNCALDVPTRVGTIKSA